MPLQEKDSDPVVFLLKAKKEGLQNIYIRFYSQNWNILDTQLITVKVKSDNYTSPYSKTQVSYSQQHPPSLELDTRLEPSITMLIEDRSRDSPTGSVLQYQVLLMLAMPQILTPAIKISEPINFEQNQDPESIFSAFFTKIENLTSKTKAFEIICTEGKNYFKDFFPKELKMKYFQLEKYISSIRVISDEAWIPWELVRPWTLDRKDEFFLCERYSFSRWLSEAKSSLGFEIGPDGRIFLPGEPMDLTNRRFENVKIVVPKTTNLPDTLKELEWITDFFIQKTGKRPSHISNRTELEEALRIGGFDILHISTHGRYDRNLPGESYFELENNEKFSIKELTGEFTRFGRNNPIIILNSCESAKQGFSLTSIQGWAKEFISYGASAFIGTIWKVNSGIALQFSRSLYTNIAKGLPLGEAVKEARTSCIHHCSEACTSNCTMKEDPSWLSYQLYGHPNSVVKFG